MLRRDFLISAAGALSVPAIVAESSSAASMPDPVIVTDSSSASRSHEFELNIGFRLLRNVTIDVSRVSLRHAHDLFLHPSKIMPRFHEHELAVTYPRMFSGGNLNWEVFFYGPAVRQPSEFRRRNVDFAEIYQRARDIRTKII